MRKCKKKRTFLADLRSIWEEDSRKSARNARGCRSMWETRSQHVRVPVEFLRLVRRVLMAFICKTPAITRKTFTQNTCFPQSSFFPLINRSNIFYLYSESCRDVSRLHLAFSISCFSLLRFLVSLVATKGILIIN